MIAMMWVGCAQTGSGLKVDTGSLDHDTAAVVVVDSGGEAPTESTDTSSPGTEPGVVEPIATAPECLFEAS